MTGLQTKLSTSLTRKPFAVSFADGDVVLVANVDKLIMWDSSKTQCLIQTMPHDGSTGKPSHAAAADSEGPLTMVAVSPYIKHRF